MDDKPASKLTYSDITPKGVYTNRRNFLFGMLATGGAVTGWSSARSLTVKVQRTGIRDSWPMWKAGPLAVNEATGGALTAVRVWTAVATAPPVSATISLAEKVPVE